MEKEFIIEFLPYELALRMKALGFDEPCLGFYDGKGSTQLYFNHKRDASGDFIPFVKSERLTWFGTPTFSQAFRWFREKYQLHSTITSISQESWQWHIQKPGQQLGKLYDEDFYTYEEAELACLEKLIEIVEQKNEK